MSDKTWETYEEVAVYLLDYFAEEFNLSLCEGKQTIDDTKSGTKWVIDGKGVKGENESFIIVECKRYTTSRISQEIVGGLAFRIFDTNSSGGIIVSPLGLQEGAELVADSQNIIPIQLTPESTTREYVMEFLNKIMVGVSDEVNLNLEDSASIKIYDKDGSLVETRKI